MRIGYFSPEIERIIAEKIIIGQDSRALNAIGNNNNIVDILFANNLFDKAQIFEPRGNDIQLNLWNAASTISANSYLAKRLQDYLNRNQIIQEQL